ncbi:hypothetical protein RJZ90_003258 [Blastomyces dermatitidis]
MTPYWNDMRPLAAHPEFTPQMLREAEGRSGGSFSETSFCSAELKTTEAEFFKNLMAGQVKTYFDWLENTHRNSIKAVSAFDSYWRLLKTLTIRTTDVAPADGLSTQYKNVVIKRWGILLSFISGARLVSLFDTRIKTIDEKAGDGPSTGASHTAHKDSKSRTDRRRHRHRPRGTGSPDLYSKAGPWIGQHDNRPIAPVAPEKCKRAHSDDDEEYRDPKMARIMAPQSCRSA